MDILHLFFRQVCQIFSNFILEFFLKLQITVLFLELLELLKTCERFDIYVFFEDSCLLFTSFAKVHDAYALLQAVFPESLVYVTIGPEHFTIPILHIFIIVSSKPRASQPCKLPKTVFHVV
jgi:hypothetical protein